jgi:hypothetical protein
MVGTTISVDRFTFAIARNAKNVLPDPVGMTTIPCRFSLIHAFNASC